MRTCLIFCHGWGGTVNFWNNLKELFKHDSNLMTLFLDLGYFKEPVDSIPTDLLHDNAINFIGIGHSLGLIKLLELNIKFKALIGLQSFIDFLGKDQQLRKIRTKELNLLINKFAANPMDTLKNFYKFVGVNMQMHDQIHEQQFKLDQYKLTRDLQLLNLSWSVDTNIPLLIVGAENDPIVPPGVIFDNFQDYPKVTIKILPTGKHGLGCKHSEVVYQNIIRFLHDIN